MQPSEILLYSLMGIFFVLGIIKVVIDVNSIDHTKDHEHRNSYYFEAKVDPRYPVVAQETVRPSTSSDSFLGTLEKPEKIKRIKSGPGKKTESKRKPTKEKYISKEGDKGNDLLLS